MGPFFSIIRPSPVLLPVLGLLERYMTPTLDMALLCSSRAGCVLGCASDWFEELFSMLVLLVEYIFLTTCLLAYTLPLISLLNGLD